MCWFKAGSSPVVMPLPCCIVFHEWSTKTAALSAPFFCAKLKGNDSGSGRVNREVTESTSYYLHVESNEKQKRMCCITFKNSRPGLMT